MKATYYVSTCPDTGRQFLVQEGVDNNIIELTPATVKQIKAIPANNEEASR